MNRLLSSLALASLLGTVPGFADNGPRFLGPGGSGYFYVTETARCYYIRDSRSPKAAYTGLYINSRPGNYDHRTDQRVYIWTDSCSDDVVVNQLVGKILFLRVKESVYSPGSWDLSIANYDSIADMAAAAFMSMPPIEFSTGSAGYGDVLVTLAKVADANPGTSVMALDTNGAPRFLFEWREKTLLYYNSRLDLGFSQRLSDEETNQLMTIMSKRPLCPVDVTISRELQRVTKVKVKCLDLSKTMNGQLAG